MSFIIEDIPVPEAASAVSAPKLRDVLPTLQVGQSIFIARDDSFKPGRQLGGIRVTTEAVQKHNPGFRFNVVNATKDGVDGFRVGRTA